MHICFSWAVSISEQIARRAIVTQITFPAVSTLNLFFPYCREAKASLFNCDQDFGPRLFSWSNRFNGSGSWVPGEYGDTFSMRVFNILDCSGNAHATENAILSHIIQETCSDRLISKEGLKPVQYPLKTNEDFCTRFYSI